MSCVQVDGEWGMKMKNSSVVVQVIVGLFASSLLIGCVPMDTESCKNWKPGPGTQWLYRVSGNYDEHHVYENKWVPQKWHGESVHVGSIIDSYQLELALPGGPGGEWTHGNNYWSKPINLDEEHKKCAAAPSCEHPEVVEVPAGKFITCKFIYKDDWGHPYIDAWEAPNIPFDGTVRIDKHDPNRYDIITRFELIDIR